MGRWKISGMVTDETPSPRDGLVTAIEGMCWPEDVPVTLDVPGKVQVGWIRLTKSNVNGRPCVMGEGDMTLESLDDTEAWRGGLGFALCGVIDSFHVANGGVGPTVTDKVRVTHVAFERLDRCFSRDYVVEFERMDEEVTT